MSNNDRKKGVTHSKHISMKTDECFCSKNDKYKLPKHFTPSICILKKLIALKKLKIIVYSEKI